MIILVPLGAAAAYLFSTWLCLEANVRRAASMGIPIVRLPIDWNNILWMVFETYVWRIVDALPVEWRSYPASIRFLRRGWHFGEKNQTHARLGPLWVLVSPVNIIPHIAEPEAISDIFGRRRDFVRPIANYKILDVFGPTISTAEVNDWPRHRKALAAPFNESIMAFVWDETLRQSRSTLTSWQGVTSGIPSVQSDTRSVSLNVLAATGFRKSYDFIGSADNRQVEAESYRQALQTVLDNAIPLMLIPYKLLMFPLMPRSWARIGAAGDLFKKYMIQMLDEETEALDKGEKGSGGIMTSLVHALEAHRADSGEKQAALNGERGLSKGLSVEEVFGNIYVINFAGHDTTANSLAFAMLLLASRPDVQDWVREEIRQVVGRTDLDYTLRSWHYQRRQTTALRFSTQKTVTS